jgi:hypothetical protein
MGISVFVSRGAKRRQGVDFRKPARGWQVDRCLLANRLNRE